MHRRFYVLLCAAFTIVAISACGGGGSSTPPTFVVSGLGTPSASGAYTLDAATTYTLTVVETASGGGAVTPGPLTITFGSAAIGTASGSAIVTGTGNASGTIKVVDSTTGQGETLNVVVLSTHPSTTGDTLSLAGTLSHTVARPLPAPVAVVPPTTTVTSVSDKITVASTDATYRTAAGLTELSASENDTAPLQTIGVKTTTYTRFQADGALQRYEAIAVNSTDTNGVIDSTVYGGGAGILDVLPDTNGQTFDNTAAQTFSEDDPDSTTVRRAVAANGTYVETDTYPGDGNVGQTQTNADLSASIVGLGGVPIDVTYTAPTGTGAGSTIGYTIAVPGDPDFTPVSGTVANWYPTTTIYSDTSAKSTAQPIPAGCTVPASVGTTATKVVETIKHLDTALGTYENRAITIYYVPGYGSVCAQLADGISTYYDYTGQSQQNPVLGINLSINATPIQIDTIYETLGFGSATVSGSSTARRAAQGLTTQAAIRVVAPIFNRAIDSVYRERRVATRTALAKEIHR